MMEFVTSLSTYQGRYKTGTKSAVPVHRGQVGELLIWDSIWGSASVSSSSTTTPVSQSGVSRS